jgi:DNA-binding PadR family transcriptional regulator
VVAVRGPLSLNATYRLGGGAADDADVAAVELDSRGGLGDQRGDGLVVVDSAEGDLLPDDHDRAGVAGPALHPDWLGGGPDGGLAIARSTVYNVYMTMRAVQEATFLILTALANGGLAIARSTVYNVYMATRAMQEATFMILTALADGAQHGYGIITDVRDISGGRVRLRAGTLYMALDRLRADELIAVDREEVVDGRLRRYYRLTPEGTKLLADEAARLQAHAAVALRRLNLAGGMAT